MPPVWPQKPDRRDPAFRRLGDRINFAFNVALYAFIISGTWFIRLLRAESWAWLTWLTWTWLAIIVLQGLYVFAIADYSKGSAPVEVSDVNER